MGVDELFDEPASGHDASARCADVVEGSPDEVFGVAVVAMLGLGQRVVEHERAAVIERPVVGERRRQVAGSAARDQQVIVNDLLAVREHEGPAGRVDLGDPAFAPNRDPVVLVVGGGIEQIVAPVALALEDLRQLVAIVEQERADRDDRDAVVRIELAQHGGGAVAGIGFTVSLLIASIAFSGQELDEAKLGILGAAIISALLSWVIFRLIIPRLPASIRVRQPAGATEILLDLSDDVVLVGDDAGAVHFSINGRAGLALGDSGTPLTARISRDEYQDWLIQP